MIYSFAMFHLLIFLWCPFTQFGDGWFWWDWLCDSAYAYEGEEIHALCEKANNSMQ